MNDNQKDLLIERLIDELVDMESTCSSGHVSRLVNVFSGINGFVLNIGFKQEIKNNIIARINKLVKDIPDEEQIDVVITEADKPSTKVKQNKKTLIYEQMTNEELPDKTVWNNFLMNNIKPIIDQLEQEYVITGLLSSENFISYTKDIISAI